MCGSGHCSERVIQMQLCYACTNGYILFPALGADVAFFGPGEGPILLDDVVCFGTESTIVECFHSGIGVHDCVHNEDAGAVCAGNDLTPNF